MVHDIKSILAQKAREELSETDQKRKQMLEQFRKWLDSHPFLKKTRRDDSFLLIFLRTKKYNLNECFKAYEKHFKFRAKRKDWFDVTEEVTYSRLKALVQCGSRYVLIDKSNAEPAIFVQRFRSYEHIQSPGSDVFYSSLIIGSAMLELEKIQICGMRAIIDFTDAPLSNIADVSLMDSIDFASTFTSGAGRFKQIIVINLPTLFFFLFNIIKMMLPEKLKKRLVVLKDHEKLKDVMDVSKLPPPFGTSTDESVYIKDTLQLLDETYENVKVSNDFVVDMSQASKVSNRNRYVTKLEID